MRLIDADSLSRFLTDNWGEVVCVDEIDNAPTIEPKTKVIAQVTFDEKKMREIVKEAVERFKEEYEITDRPQGEWIWDNDAVDWNLGAWICSNCHARNDNIPHSEKIIPLRWSGSKFCPNCGADMREREDE
jgi:rubrerythrin